MALLTSAAPAAAQSTNAPATDDRWQLRVAPYLWATSLDGNAAVAGIKSDVDLSPRSCSRSAACSARRSRARCCRAISRPPATAS